MHKYKWNSRYGLFQFFNYSFLIILSLVCLIPMLHEIAVSFSASTPAQAGDVNIFPIGFNLTAYQYVLETKAFWQALLVSLERVLLSGVLGIGMTILTAYPMSKSEEVFPHRRYFVWFLFVTMIFHGGLIPSYLVVRYTGLIDTIWALVIPGIVQVFNIILLLNFFRQLPKELDEASFIDGSNHWNTLWKIYIPLSAPSIATITLFTAVGNWNAWFDGMLYMNDARNYPLQTYLQSIINEVTDVSSELDKVYNSLSAETVKAAQIVICALPLLILYPFLQKHFTSGIVLGSVKG